MHRAVLVVHEEDLAVGIGHRAPARGQSSAARSRAKGARHPISRHAGFQFGEPSRTVRGHLSLSSRARLLGNVVVHVILKRVPLDLVHLLLEIALLDPPLASTHSHVAQRELHDLLVLLAIFVEGDRRLVARDVDAAVLAPVARLRDPVLRHVGGGNRFVRAHA